MTTAMPGEEAPPAPADERKAAGSAPGGAPRPFAPEAAGTFDAGGGAGEADAVAGAGWAATVAPGAAGARAAAGAGVDGAVGCAARARLRRAACRRSPQPTPATTSATVKVRRTRERVSNVINLESAQGTLRSPPPQARSVERSSQTAVFQGSEATIVTVARKERDARRMVRCAFLRWPLEGVGLRLSAAHAAAVHELLCGARWRRAGLDLPSNLREGSTKCGVKLVSVVPDGVPPLQRAGPAGQKVAIRTRPPTLSVST